MKSERSSCGMVEKSSLGTGFKSMLRPLLSPCYLGGVEHLVAR